MERLAEILGFVEEAERLKDVTRCAWTSSGRHESTAEHSWRLALLALALMDETEGLDGFKVLSLCLVHDLGELYEGDTPAPECADEDEKYLREQRGAMRACALLPQPQAGKLLALWEEYAAGQTAEAKWVKALDKAETILQHNQGAASPPFSAEDFQFNLQYGRRYFADGGLLSRLRELLDQKTAARIAQCGDAPPAP